MTPLRYIRTAILDLPLEAIGAALGRTPATVSKWERGDIPEPPLRALRDWLSGEFHRRGLAWHDSLLFEVPVCDDCHSPGSCVPVCARMAGDGCALEARAPVGEAA